MLEPFFTMYRFALHLSTSIKKQQSSSIKTNCHPERRAYSGSPTSFACWGEVSPESKDNAFDFDSARRRRATAFQLLITNYGDYNLPSSVIPTEASQRGAEGPCFG